MSVVNLRSEVYFYDKKLLPAYFFSTSSKSLCQKVILYDPVEDVLAFSAFTYFFTHVTEVDDTQGSEIPPDLLAETTFPALSTVYAMVIDPLAVQL